jgi:hypothetical protein
MAWSQRPERCPTKVILMKDPPELFLLCLISTLVTFVAMARDDVLFTTFFAAASGLTLTLALRQGGDK